MHTLIGTDQPDAWRSALHGLAHGYWHTWEACDAIAAGTGLQVFLYSHIGPDGSRAACVFAERHYGDEVDIFTPAGFSGFVGEGSPASVRRAWLDFVAERGYVCGYFTLHPAVANAALHSSLDTSNTLFLVDLSAGASTVFSKSDRYVRRVLRDWQQSASEIVTDRAALTHFVLVNYAAFMASVGADPRAIWSEKTLESMLKDESVLMAGAADDEGICAVHTFATTPCVADAHLNISVRGGRRAVTPLIIWGIQALADRQVPWLNLGGGVVAGDSVALAKEKFGPERAPLQVAREIYRPATYAELCAQSGVDADAVGGFFPRYRSRQAIFLD